MSYNVFSGTLNPTQSINRSIMVVGAMQSERATWPKKRSRLVLMIVETGGQPVVSLTETFITCLTLIYGNGGARRIFFGVTMCQRHPVAEQEPL